MNQNALVVQGLAKTYDGFALKDVSFRVPSGAIVGLIGENGAGFLLGILVGCAAALGKNAFDGETMGIFSCISLALALLSGSVTIPLNFLWTEEKSMLSLILAYPLSAALFAGSALLLPDKRVACAAVAALSLLLFAPSWLLARRRMAHTGIV